MIDLAVIFSGSLAVLLIAGWLTMTVLGNQRRLRARVEKIGERSWLEPSHNCTGRNCTGRKCTGRTYVGHTCIGHNYIGQD